NRLDFKPGLAVGSAITQGGWGEQLASDRALCVQFQNGVPPVSMASPFAVTSRATVIKGAASFAFSQTANASANLDANVPVPVDGVPIPVTATSNTAFGLQLSANGSFNTAN